MTRIMCCFYFGLYLLISLSNATCVTLSATTDTTPDPGTVPEAPTTSPAVTDSITFDDNWYFFPLNPETNPVFDSREPISFINGELTFGTYFGDSDVSNAVVCSVVSTWDERCFIGSYGWVFPGFNTTTSPFMKLYNQYNHAQELWYTLSFDFMQALSNQYYEAQHFTIRAAIFNMSALDTYWFNNSLAQKWIYPFGALHSDGTDTTNYIRESIGVILDDTMESQGIYIWDEHEFGEAMPGVYMSWPPVQAVGNWETLEVTFKFKEEENTPPCSNCFVAIWVESNTYPYWGSNTSWSIRNLELIREEADVIWPHPITSFDSELVEIRRMEYLTDVEQNGWPRIDCPHEWSFLFDWHDPSTWDSGVVPTTNDSNITLPNDKRVIIRSCSLNSTELNPYQKIIIPLNGTLIFDDVDILIFVEEIYNDGGEIWIGSETCRLYSNIELTFVGNRNDSWKSFPILSDHAKSKGIASQFGRVNIHGKQFHPTWTRLAITVYPGDNIIYLQESVNWEVGQKIVLITSAFYDYENEHQNEEVIIAAIGDSVWTNRNVIYLGDEIRTQYTHYAGVEYQAEVLLLSRNIKFIGSDSNDKFGGHTAVHFPGSVGKFSGIEAYNMGQQNVEGRYPFHFHMIGDCPECFVRDCSVHKSHFRCVTVHGTNNMTVTRHVSYNSFGHCLYIEDGVEENNTLSYNALTHVHPIAHSAGGSCQGEIICRECNGSYFQLLQDLESKLPLGGSVIFNFKKEELLIPSDTAASPFYAVNTYNRFIGNVASGGWSGFAFINFKEPLGKYLGSDPQATDEYRNPYNRPALEFDGNVAHSSGFRWADSGCGSCFYGGGELLYHGEEKTYIYTTGRVQHDTRVAYTGEKTWIHLTNTKTYLCPIGINWWGNRIIIDKFESHDAQRGSFFIGENVLTNAIVNARSQNKIGSSQIGHWWLPQDSSRGGHQLYDTGVHLFLENIIWRNFRKETIIRFLTFSNIFTPQGLAAVKNMTFDNCTNPELFVFYDHCGETCAVRDNNSPINIPSIETHAARMYAIYDYDGSASGTNKPTIISTHWNWWNKGDDCQYNNDSFLWYCPFIPYQNEIGYVRIDIPGLTDGYRNNPNPIAAALNGEIEEDEIVGYVSQFGRNYSILYPNYPSVAGPTNMGWYFRSIYGAPQYWFIGPAIQLPHKTFVVISMKYPPQTTFSVQYTFSIEDSIYTFDLKNAQSMDEIYTKNETLFDDLSLYNCELNDPLDPLQFCKDTGAIGPLWYFNTNDGFFYIRIINPIYYINPVIWGENGRPDFFMEWNGMKLWDIFSGLNFVVTATCDQCVSSHNGFYDVVDSLPPKWPHQNWGVQTTTTVPDTTIIETEDDDQSGKEEETGNGISTGIIVLIIVIVVLLIIGAIFILIKILKKKKNAKNIQAIDTAIEMEENKSNSKQNEIEGAGILATTDATQNQVTDQTYV